MRTVVVRYKVKSPEAAAENEPVTLRPDIVAAPETVKMFRIVLLPTVKSLADSSVVPPKDPPVKFWPGAAG